jgi:trk system potassium uptake protein TrkA
MRAVFIGASRLTVMTTRLLLERGHEVVIIERDRETIDELSEDLDCGFLHGDGSKPAMLKEASPEEGTLLFCLTSDDETNILASLVGRSLGFGRVVTKIEDPELEHICIELGLEDTIIPTRTISRYLAEMISGQDILELSAMVGDDTRFFAFSARDEDAGPLKELGLPEGARVSYFYRDGKLRLPDGDTKLREGDEVVVVCHRDAEPKLAERWGGSKQGRSPRGLAAGG